MEILVEASGLVVSVVVGLVAARVILTGVLAMTFGRRP
jgi:hypothetical protein